MVERARTVNSPYLIEYLLDKSLLDSYYEIALQYWPIVIFSALGTLDKILVGMLYGSKRVFYENMLKGEV